MRPPVSRPPRADHRSRIQTARPSPSRRPSRPKTAVPAYCFRPSPGAAGQPITTLEGLGTPEKPHRLQTAFIAEQAAQCGFCINGMLMASASFLERGVIDAHSTDDDIKKAMAPWLCRCGTHYRIVAAIKRAARAQA